MPGTFNDYAVGYRESIFATPEVTFGVAVHPAAVDAFQVLPGSSFEYTQERVNRGDKTSSRSYRERISRRKTASWSITAYLLPSGTSGVAPDTDLLLTNVLGAKRTLTDTTIAATPATTATILQVTSAATWSVGDALGWVNPAGELETTFITNIAGIAVTVSPAFSAAPAVAATIKGGVSYRLANVVNPMTITRVLDNLAQVFVGSIANEATFEFPGDGEGNLAVSGMSKTAHYAGSGEIAVAVTAPATTITMATGQGKRFRPSTRVQIEEEVVLITGVAGDVLTVTRAQAGTTAVAHSTVGTQVGPYEPPQTVAGSPVTGTVGDFIIVGAASARERVSVTTASVTLNNNIEMRNNEFGTDSATGFSTTGRREVSFSVTMWLQKQFMSRYGDAANFTGQRIVIQLGRTIGSTVALLIGQTEFDIPSVPGGGDEEVSVSVTGMSLASAVNNDEMTLAFL